MGYVIIMAGNKLHYELCWSQKCIISVYSLLTYYQPAGCQEYNANMACSKFTDYIIRKAEIQDIPEIVVLLNNEHKERCSVIIYDETTFHEII